MFFINCFQLIIHLSAPHQKLFKGNMKFHISQFIVLLFTIEYLTNLRPYIFDWFYFFMPRVLAGKLESSKTNIFKTTTTAKPFFCQLFKFLLQLKISVHTAEDKLYRNNNLCTLFELTLPNKLHLGQ